MTEEDVGYLIRELESAAPKLGYAHCSEPLNKRNGLEANYSRMYQKLVRLGVRPQLRKKYR